LSKGVKRRLRELYRALDPVALLAEMRTPRRSSARASTPERQARGGSQATGSGNERGEPAGPWWHGHAFRIAK
jgi:hypothetical protein